MGRPVLKKVDFAHLKDYQNQVIDMKEGSAITTLLVICPITGMIHLRMINGEKVSGPGIELIGSIDYESYENGAEVAEENRKMFRVGMYYVLKSEQGKWVSHKVVKEIQVRDLTSRDAPRVSKS